MARALVAAKAEADAATMASAARQYFMPESYISSHRGGVILVRSMAMQDDKVSTSSIVMRAMDATTYSELQAFTKDLESRPVERLLRDVAELVLPSESKAHIVSYVIATKHRNAGAVERRNISDSLSA